MRTRRHTGRSASCLADCRDRSRWCHEAIAASRDRLQNQPRMPRVSAGCQHCRRPWRFVYHSLPPQRTHLPRVSNKAHTDKSEVGGVKDKLRTRMGNPRKNCACCKNHCPSLHREPTSPNTQMPSDTCSWPPRDSPPLATCMACERREDVHPPLAVEVPRSTTQTRCAERISSQPGTPEGV